MANNYDITNVKLNGLTIGLIKLNGNIVYPIGEQPAIDFPYDDCDCYIVYHFQRSLGANDAIPCTIIDATQPYSINGREMNEYSIMAQYASYNSEYELKLINLKPHTNSSKPTYTSPMEYHQLRLPTVTDLSYLFRRFNMGYDGGSRAYGTPLWQPQYFEFHPYPTNMSRMFHNSLVTDELMYQFIPYFPNTSKVTNMYYMFDGCHYLDTSLKDLVAKFDTSSVTRMDYMFGYCSSLTSLDLSSWDIGSVTNMSAVFNGCSNLKELHLESWDTSKLYHKYTTSGVNSMFGNVKDCTIYVTDKKWTLGIAKNQGYGTNLNFIVLDENNNVVPRPTDLLLDFTQPTISTQMPTWIDFEKTVSPLVHGTYFCDDSVYGLVEEFRVKATDATASQNFWNCYKITAPITGELKIKYRVNTKPGSYGLAIHATSDATQPTYNNATNRIAYVGDSIYPNEDRETILNVVAGETYYIHIQFIRYYSQTDDTYGVCIRSFEIIPSISSIDLTYDIDVDNVEQSTFTIEPVIPNNETINDLEIVYDSNYMRINPTTYEVELSEGSQGMSHTITYRSKADNSISKSITFYVNENLVLSNYLVDLAQLPTWFTEYRKDTTRYFTYGDYPCDKNIHGLVDYYISTSNASGTYWTCYKLVAPTTGTLNITYRANTYSYNGSSSYPFTIHATTSYSQPTYSSETNRIAFTYGDACKDTDGIATFEVTQGKTYYIHVQYKGYTSKTVQYGTCISSIEIIPS